MKLPYTIVIFTEVVFLRHVSNVLLEVWAYLIGSSRSVSI